MKLVQITSNSILLFQDLVNLMFTELRSREMVRKLITLSNFYTNEGLPGRLMGSNHYVWRTVCCRQAYYQLYEAC